MDSNVCNKIFKRVERRQMKKWDYLNQKRKRKKRLKK